MAIAVRGSAWDPFTVLVRQFDTDFDHLVRRSFGAPIAKRPTATFVPAADVAKDGQDVVVTLELPGVDVDKDIDIEVSEGRLVISGTRGERHESTEDGVLVREIRSGGFRRAFSLPKGITGEQVEAGYQNGLLTVRVHDVVRPAVTPTKVKVHSLTATTGAPQVESTEVTEGTDSSAPEADQN
ncbi:MAG TPA: Hsp20/alpha crystallin family protein [Pseudonocardiaceae bacterium]|jgi:HSP20 family protein|nr:Hsp20/alpha crystallin family protein [Pseudonocardiaceae bacterium]